MLAASGRRSRAQMPLRCDIIAAFLSREACMQDLCSSSYACMLWCLPQVA